MSTVVAFSTSTFESRLCLIFTKKIKTKRGIAPKCEFQMLCVASSMLPRNSYNKGCRKAFSFGGIPSWSISFVGAPWKIPISNHECNFWKHVNSKEYVMVCKMKETSLGKDVGYAFTVSPVMPQIHTHRCFGRTITIRASIKLLVEWIRGACLKALKTPEEYCQQYTIGSCPVVGR